MAIGLEFFNDDIIRILIELAIAGIALFEVHDAALIDRAERLDAVFEAGVEIIDAMVRSRMDDAGAGILGDEAIDDDGRKTVIERMMDRDVFHLLAFEALEELAFAEFELLG
jgi:hypothetical protein